MQTETCTFAIHECIVVLSFASVCVSVCNAPTFESLDLESLFLVYSGTSSEYLGHVCNSRSSDKVTVAKKHECLSCTNSKFRMP